MKTLIIEETVMYTYEFPDDEPLPFREDDEDETDPRPTQEKWFCNQENNVRDAKYYSVYERRCELE